MSTRVLTRLVLPLAGVLLTTTVVVKSGTLESARSDWLTRRSGLSAEVPGAPEGSPGESRVIAEGRVTTYPGAEVVVGTEAAGRIVTMDVREKSVLRRGDLIAEINADVLRAEAALASARVLEAESDIRFYDRELKRDETLMARRAGTAQNVDQNRRGLDSSRARRAAATAERDRIEALIDKTRITAPIDGVVTARHAHPGETVEIAARLVTIADLTRIRIEAEVDEYDSGRVSPGAEVRITSEGFPGSTWKGTVEEIPDTVVGRRIRPEDPGRPIDARVLPVKITFNESTPLKLGQRVEVEILEKPER
jgi:RND family efflux transporter MFP subunit